jgi:hypothetical protein
MEKEAASLKAIGESIEVLDLGNLVASSAERDRKVNWPPQNG